VEKICLNGNRLKFKTFLRGLVCFLLAITAALIAWMVVGYTLYRVPSGEQSVVFQGEVHYKVVEMAFSNREAFEYYAPGGLKLVRIEGSPDLFVSAADRKRLWPEDPFTMMDKGYTLNAKIRASPLLFGGYGVSNVATVERINGQPHISK
jgi:hypothetical protein